jgi:hypothetical protein
MERRLSMTRWESVLVFALFCYVVSSRAVADHQVVLVVAANSTIESIDPLDIRKIYLGFQVRDGSNFSIHAATNLSGRTLYEIFLQDVMAMSAANYDRRLLTLTLQSGHRRPDVFKNIDELLSALRRDPNLVTFMWFEDYEKAKDLKVLRILWKK